MSLIARLAVALLFSLAPFISALQVTPGSTCATQCLDFADGKAGEATASSTIPGDIVCGDLEYASSKAGKKFVGCLDCLQQSTKVEGPESDIAWYLYNLRFAVDVCLFSPNSTAHNGSSSNSGPRQCDLDATCGPLKTALQSNIKSPSNETEFEYCTADNRAFQGKVAGECTQCLRQTADRTYLSNFMIALQAACQQQPKPGVLLGLSGTVFQLSAISATTVSPSPGANNGTPNAAVLSLGAIVGIAVGGGVAFLLGAILFVIYYRRQRRYQLEDLNREVQYPTVHLNFPPPGNGPTTSGSSLTAHDHFLASPNFTTDYKRRGSDPSSHENFEKTFASNAEFYDQMSTHESLGGRGISDATTVTASGQPESVAAMPAHPAYIPRTLARPSRTESPKPRIGLPSEPRPPGRQEDSYTLQQYLASVEEARGPPPNDPASARSIPQSFRSGMASPPSRSAVPVASPPARKDSLASPPAQTIRSPPHTSASARHNPNGETVASPGKAPSIHSNVSVVPSLILPNLPRKGRRNKGGAAANFAAAVGKNSQPGQDISAPLSFPEERFVDGRVSRMRGEAAGLPGTGSDDDKIVERTLVRPAIKGYQEVPIASGKSFLYG